MQTKVSFTVDDAQWPKLQIVGELETERGQRIAFVQKVLYDQAYLQFENLLHNQLRQAVQLLIERRKQQ